MNGMNDALLRRMIGAAVLLLAALVIVALLPGRTPAEAEKSAGDPANQVKVLALDETGDIAIEAIDPARQADLPAAQMASPDLTADPAAPDMDVAAAGEGVPDDPQPEVAPEPVTPMAEAAKPQSKPAPEPATRPATKPATKPATRPAPEPASKPERAAQAPAAAQPAPAPKATAGGHWWVQIGSFSKVETARSVQDKLAAQGLKSVVAPVPFKDTTLYRVRSGPFADRQAAVFAQKRAAAAGYPQTQVVSY